MQRKEAVTITIINLIKIIKCKKGASRPHTGFEGDILFLLEAN